MKKLITYMLMGLTMAVLFNCKKYPEGGWERRGPRLILGNWKLSLYEVNGIDSTNLINYNGNEDYKAIKIFKNVDVFQIEQKSSIGYSISFMDNNETLRTNGRNDTVGSKCTLYNNFNYCFRYVFRPDGLGATDWTVKKLTKTECTLAHSGVKSYKIKLSR